MIPPSLESTSCSSAGILNLCLHPSCPGALPLFLPLVSAFSGKQPRGSSFDRLVPNLPPADFIKHALSVQCTLRLYIALTQMVSYAAKAQVLEYFAPASSAYAGRLANCNREFHSLPVVPTVYTCICGGVHRAGTSSLCCTCACHCVHRADTSSVSRRASTSTGVLRACVFSICWTFCKLQQRVSFSPCRAHRLHLHLWWSTSRRHQQFMLHLRLSLCTSRWHKQCLTPRKHKYWSTSRLRLQLLPDVLQTATESFILSLSCPPSTLALMVEYIAPAPAVYAAPAPVIVYIALTQAVSYAAQAQVLEYFAPASSAYAEKTKSFILSLSCPPSTLTLMV